MSHCPTDRRSGDSLKAASAYRGPVPSPPAEFPRDEIAYGSTAEAQVITGNILGTVRDETGAVLPGASVTIRSPALLGGPAVFVTNEKGQYRFPALAPGLYSLMVEIPGFSTYMEDGLRVQVGATIETNVTLPLAALAESLTVTAESPLLDTKDSGQSTHYGNEAERPDSPFLKPFFLQAR